MRSRKMLLGLGVLGALTLLLVCLWAQAPSGPSLEERCQAADARVHSLRRREEQLARMGASDEEKNQARKETDRAVQEARTLGHEYWAQKNSWHEWLREELRDRTGW